jgi:uncharacterized OB-fold protein
MAQTLTARVWREQPQRYRMLGNRCLETGEICFPPRLVAAGNLQATFTEHLLGQKGRVLTYTVIRVPPSPFSDLAPYALAVIETEDGARLTAQVTDCGLDEVKIGLEVRFEFRRLYEENSASVIYYGYKAVPAR